MITLMSALALSTAAPLADQALGTDRHSAHAEPGDPADTTQTKPCCCEGEKAEGQTGCCNKHGGAAAGQASHD